jgi:CRISPR-associated protein Csx10
MRAILYRLTLREPLLATSLQGDPNSSVSLSYVSGSLVRGALIQHYIRKYEKAQLLEDADARRLFIDGSTRYLHAYPLTTQSNQRSLPTPRSLLRRKHAELNEKEDQIELLDASHPDCNPMARAQFERPDLSQQPDMLKSLSVPFCASLGATIYTYRPERTIAVHIQRNPIKGRSLRNPARNNTLVSEQQLPDGAVFRYDALAPEQQFGGIVLVENDDDAATIEMLLTELGTCWLGRSRSAQYGKTTISDITSNDQWRECNPDDPATPALTADDGDLHSVTFLSDALLRDRAGNPTTCLDSKTLAAYLELSEGAVIIDEQHSFSATTEISGFNRFWKLPLAQEYALAAGSVISFRLKQPLSAEQVIKLEQRGLGARRAEGFGRIAFNWRDTLERQAKKGAIATAPIASSATNRLAEHSKVLAKRMARQLYERSVEQSIVEFVKDTSVSQPPENSQLGRLRMLVRQALPTSDVEFVRTHFAEFKSTARNQFARARLGDESFGEWIEHLLVDPGHVWTQFNNFNFNAQKIADQVAERNDRQVALQLLAAVLAAPTREERGQETQP